MSDIFIKNEIIVDIRKSNVNDKCLEEIDANGLIVTPGFVDIHTHYDGQVTWDNTLALLLGMELPRQSWVIVE